MGQKSWNSILKTNKISKDKFYNNAVKRVGSSIASVVNEKDYHWSFVVLNSNQPNAFCLPGGKVAVYSGLFKYLKNDAELATVLGHEIGHAIARHGGERMTQQYTQQISGALLQTALEHSSVPYSNEYYAAYGAATNIGIILPYSRTQEYEADHLGIIFMAKAGYNPRASLKFWETFSKLSTNSNLQEFFATHPAGEKRLNDLKTYLPKAMKIYEQAKNRKDLGVIYNNR